MILSKRIQRVSALAFALTFQVTAGMDALGLHDCPHHDAIGSGTIDHAGAHPDGPHAPSGHGHGSHGAPAAPAAHGAHGGSSGSNAPSQHSQHGQHGGACTCVGSCQLGGTTLGGPASRQAGVAPAILVAARIAPPSREELLPGAPAFFLPLANAPPGPADFRL